MNNPKLSKSRDLLNHAKGTYFKWKKEVVLVSKNDILILRKNLKRKSNRKYLK